MKSQFRDPDGMLNCLHNAVSNDAIFFMLTEACESFDPCMIRRNQVVSEQQKATLLDLAKYPLTLKKQIRLFMRKLMGARLLHSADEFDIPKTLKKYLLFDYSWGIILWFFFWNRWWSFVIFTIIYDDDFVRGGSLFRVYWYLYFCKKNWEKYDAYYSELFKIGEWFS